MKSGSRGQPGRAWRNDPATEDRQKNSLPLDCVLGMKVSPKGKLTMRSMNCVRHVSRRDRDITIVATEDQLAKCAAYLASRRLKSPRITLKAINRVTYGQRERIKFPEFELEMRAADEGRRIEYTASEARHNLHL